MTWRELEDLAKQDGLALVRLRRKSSALTLSVEVVADRPDIPLLTIFAGDMQPEPADKVLRLATAAALREMRISKPGGRPG